MAQFQYQTPFFSNLLGVGLCTALGVGTAARVGVAVGAAKVSVGGDCEAVGAAPPQASNAAANRTARPAAKFLVGSSEAIRSEALLLNHDIIQDPEVAENRPIVSLSKARSAASLLAKWVATRNV